MQTAWRRQLRWFALVLVLLCSPTGARAFHFPWDQGHDTFVPEGPDQPDDAGDDISCTQGSPVELGTGNFKYAEVDLTLPTRGTLDLSLTRFYNSLDRRDGPFGVGWSFTYDWRVIRASDGARAFAICRKGDGKRSRFTFEAGELRGPEGISAQLKAIDGAYIWRDPSGQSIEFSGSGRPVRLADSEGNTFDIAYDARGRLATVSGPGGTEVVFVFGPDGRIASVTDSAGRTTRYSYTTQGFLASSTGPTGIQRNYSYDEHGRLSRVADNAGRAIQSVTYDLQSRATSWLANSGRWTAAYGATGDRVVETDPQGGNWVYQLNASGSITVRTAPDGSSEHYEYDSRNWITSYRDRDGNRQEYAYADSGTRTLTRYPDGAELRVEMSPVFDRPARVTNGTGLDLQFAWDVNGRLVSLQDALGRTRRWVYGDAGGGLQITETDKRGEEWKVIVGGFGKPTRVTNPLGASRDTTFGAVGEAERIRDENGHEVAVDRDSGGRILETTDSLGSLVKLEYDSTGWLAAILDGLGNRTEFKRNEHGQIVERKNAEGAVTRNTYDGAGRLSVAQFEDGSSQAYQYDALGRVSRVSAGTTVWTATYDGASRIVGAELDGLSVRRAYDSRGLITEETQDVGDGSQFTVRYRYSGSRELLEVSDSLGRVVTYGYDEGGRPASVAINGRSHVTYEYGSGSFPRRLRFSNGVVQQNDFDAAGRIVRQTLTLADGDQRMTEYDYDQSSAPTRVRVGANERTYDYDARGRLLLVTKNGTLAESYGYDAGNNRVTALDGSPYVIGIDNRLLQGAGFTNTYDGRGRLVRSEKTDDGTRLDLSYVLGGLVGQATTRTGDVVTYKYDAFGRRVVKASAGLTERYLYDGNKVVAVLKNGVLSERVVFRPDNDEPLEFGTDGMSSPVHVDVGGSVWLRTDASGAAAAEYDYDSFGRPLSEVPFLGYKARQWDPETGFYYFRARLYDPVSGRFIAPDPLEFRGSVNRYDFALANPVKYSDRFGFASYLCKRPLGNYNPGDNERNGPDVPGNPLYHQYICVDVGCNLPPRCDSQAASGNPLYSPGRGTTPKEDYYDPTRCEQTDPTNECLENCILNGFDGPRPGYGVGPQGTDCQEWTNDLLSKCHSQCQTP